MSGIFNQPRMRLLANGVALPVLRADVRQTGYYGASTFSATLAVFRDTAHGPAFWAGSDTYDVELQGGFLAAGAAEGSASWQSLFMGQADEELEIDLDCGTVSLQGRDYSGKLMDAKTAETFSNQTLAQIATTLAGRVGLQAEVSSTSQLAGQFYEIDHARTAHDIFSRSSSYWELITYLAQQEGYDVWVDGMTLYVQPKDAASTTPAFTVQSSQPSLSGSADYGRVANVQRLALTRRPALAKDVQVTVKSWGGKSKAMVSGKDGPASAIQKVIKTFPNLTQAQCAVMARTIRADLGRHERGVHFGMPGEFTLRPRDAIAVRGTGTAFDTIFYISEIDRSYSDKAGFWQSVLARNLPPQSDQGAP
jgi:phage protein D